MQLRTALLPLLATCVLLGACGGGGDGPAADATPPTSSTPTTTRVPNAVSDDEAQVRAVATGWYEAALRLGGDPDPDDPAFDRYFGNELADWYRQKYRQMVDEGLRAREPVNPRTQYLIFDVVIVGNTATFRECVVDDWVLYRASTGEVVNDEVNTDEIATTAERVDGSWKIQTQKQISEIEGVAGCALAK